MNWDDAIAYWKRVKSAVNPAAEDAANAMAEELKKGIRDELSRYPHPAHTRTSSPAGQPPGLITGALRESVQTTPAYPVGDAIWEAHVGPHIIYAAIQEYGGTMHAHRDYMSWVTDGVRYYAKDVTLPPRPYIQPAVSAMSKSGILTRAARDGFATVIYSAEGI
jgi:phage gpG-like protein